MSLIDPSRRLALAAAGLALVAAPALADDDKAKDKGKKRKGPGQEKETPAVEDLMREHGVLRRALLVYEEVAPRLQRDPAKFDLATLARHSDGFSGAEIEQAIISGLYDSFSNNADLDTAALLQSVTETVPLSKTMSEDLGRLRTWAQGRARPATGAVPIGSVEMRRKLEL